MTNEREEVRVLGFRRRTGGRVSGNTGGLKEWWRFGGSFWGELEPWIADADREGLCMRTSSTMLLWVLFFSLVFPQTGGYFAEEKYAEESEMQAPTVVMAVIARNAAHSLPHYLGALERLNYPKERISIW